MELPASEPLEPQHQRVVEEQSALREAVRVVAPDVAVPYFAHMRLQSGGRSRDVLLGPQARVAAGVAVVDWRTAPLAEVFFGCEEGEEYEVEVGTRTLAGTLLERSLVGFADGEVVEIVRGGDVLTRRDGGDWRRLARPAWLLPRAPQLRGRERSPIEVELDRAQRQVVELPAGRHSLVLGEAGFGKTTVALHRLAALRRAATGPFRAAVVVPTDGLRRLTEALLERLGAEGVEVRLYDHWAGAQARRAFRGLPRRESRDATAGVIRFKRHPALREALHELAARRPRIGRAALLHLFGDRDLVEHAAAAAGGAIAAHVVEEVLEHAHVQFSNSAEDEYAHVDAERLQALDGASLDDGTPMEDAGTVDAEDYAVLFELDRLAAAAGGARPIAPRAYDCLVVDEAQELAPLELALLGRSLARGGTMIVAGDAGQQIDPTASFAGWERAMAELGVAAYETATLEQSYRCPPEVTALARRILDPAAPAGPAGGRAALARFDDECRLAAELTDALRALFAHDASATVAVITRAPEGARRLAGLLRRGLTLRLVLDGDFQFQAGINVTHVQESKGLEFDYVVVPDASAAAYPDAPESRRALYVASTRATHQLLLAAVGRFTPLLDGAASPTSSPPHETE
ncbi:MAG TPA: ATP-binding domain-containing protein [Myxococcota bacterium]|nr:ATP-binding domain-containing protein [Myxococcota bacterium]